MTTQLVLDGWEKAIVSTLNNNAYEKIKWFTSSIGDSSILPVARSRFDLGRLELMMLLTLSPGFSSEFLRGERAMEDVVT